MIRTYSLVATISGSVAGHCATELAAQLLLLLLLFTAIELSLGGSCPYTSNK
jgi:hypothetical protein